MDVENDFGNLGHVPPESAVTIGRNTHSVCKSSQARPSSGHLLPPRRRSHSGAVVFTITWKTHPREY